MRPIRSSRLAGYIGNIYIYECFVLSWIIQRIIHQKRLYWIYCNLFRSLLSWSAQRLHKHIFLANYYKVITKSNCFSYLKDERFRHFINCHDFQTIALIVCAFTKPTKADQVSEHLLILRLFEIINIMCKILCKIMYHQFVYSKRNSEMFLFLNAFGQFNITNRMLKFLKITVFK